MATGGSRATRLPKSEPSKRTSSLRVRVDSEERSSIGSSRQEDRPNNWVRLREIYELQWTICRVCVVSKVFVVEFVSLYFNLSPAGVLRLATCFCLQHWQENQEGKRGERTRERSVAGRLPGSRPNQAQNTVHVSSHQDDLHHSPRGASCFAESPTAADVQRQRRGMTVQ